MSERRESRNYGDDAVSIGAAPSDRVNCGDLRVPDAKRVLWTTTVTVAAEGWQPVRGVPLDLLGRGTHVFKMTRAEVGTTMTFAFLVCLDVFGHVVQP